MAEALSLVASIIAVVGAGGQLAKIVRRLASIKDAPDIVLALHNEITDLHLVVVAIEDVFQKQRTSGIPFPGNRAGEIHIDANVTSSLRYAQDKTADLEALYQRLAPSASGSPGSSQIDKKAWLRIQKIVKTTWLRERMKEIQRDLRSARLRLTTALGILNSSSLQYLQEGVHATQNTVRDLRTLQQQIESVQGQRAASQADVAQSIQDKIGELQILQHRNGIAQVQRSAESEAALQEPISQLLVGQRHMNLKLESIEAGFSANIESHTRAMMQSMFKPWGPSDRTWTTGSVRITTTSSCSNGVNHCLCNCHRHGRSTKRTPKSLNPLLGILFIGYLGVPYINEPCDDADCAQRSGSDLRLVYFFPAWLLSRAFVLLLKLSPVRGPELNIHMPRIVSNTSRIFTYAAEGDIDGMNDILNRGLGSPMDVDKTTGNTALMLAINNFRLDICKLLLHAGADPQAENYYSRTCIETCWNNLLANRGDENTRQQFRALFPAPDLLEEMNLSLLHRTVLGLSPMRLDIVLEHLPGSAIDQGDARDRTALWWAAKRGDSTTTSLLLRSGADTSKMSTKGISPLISAIESHNQTCIRLILEYGAEIHNLDLQGWLPVHVACYFGSDVDIVENLLDGRISVDEKIQDVRETPLTLAVEGGHVQIIKYLIAQGADINAANSDGQTSLLIATSNKRPGSMTLLLQNEADYLCTTKAGENVLHYAAQFGDLSCLNALYAFDLADLNVDDRVISVSPTQRMRNIKGLTALQIAEKRTDVTEEWREVFRKVVHGIQHPELKSPINIGDETEEFEDALEQQLG